LPVDQGLAPGGSRFGDGKLPGDANARLGQLAERPRDPGRPLAEDEVAPGDLELLPLLEEPEPVGGIRPRGSERAERRPEGARTRAGRWGPGVQQLGREISVCASRSDRVKNVSIPPSNAGAEASRAR
jgi:hypothetical protein